MYFTLPTIDWVRLPDGSDPVQAPHATRTVDEVAVAAAAAGFQEIGVDTVTAAAFVGGGESELARILETARVRCSEVGVLSVGAFDARGAAAALSRLATATGARVCVTTLDAEPSPTVVAQLRACADQLADHGVRLALEFLPYGPLATLEGAIDVCDSVGWERCGLLLDSWHFFRSGAPWDVLGRVAGDQIVLVQINDAPPLDSCGLQFESRFRRVLPGLGEFDLPRFVDVLQQSGYDGGISPEVLSSEVIVQPLEVATSAMFASLQSLWPLSA